MNKMTPGELGKELQDCLSTGNIVHLANVVHAAISAWEADLGQARAELGTQERLDKLTISGFRERQEKAEACIEALKKWGEDAERTLVYASTVLGPYAKNDNSAKVAVSECDEVFTAWAGLKEKPLDRALLPENVIGRSQVTTAALLKGLRETCWHAYEGYNDLTCVLCNAMAEDGKGQDYLDTRHNPGCLAGMTLEPANASSLTQAFGATPGQISQIMMQARVAEHWEADIRKKKALRTAIEVAIVALADAEGVAETRNMLKLTLEENR